MVEQIVVHEIPVALVMLSGKPLVFVQVHAMDGGKVQIPLVVPFNQLFISPYGSRSCSQSQYSLRFQNKLRGNHICRFTAHFIIIFYCINYHNLVPFPFLDILLSFITLFQYIVLEKSLCLYLK